MPEGGRRQKHTSRSSRPDHAISQKIAKLTIIPKEERSEDWSITYRQKIAAGPSLLTDHYIENKTRAMDFDFELDEENERKRTY